MGFSWDRMYWFSIRFGGLLVQTVFKSIDCFSLSGSYGVAFLLFGVGWER